MTCQLWYNRPQTLYNHTSRHFSKPTDFTAMNNPESGAAKASLSDYLAAERTLLAWIRTGLAMMGFGFVVARFGLFLQELHVVQNSAVVPHTGVSLWFGTALIVVGVFVNAIAGLRHLRLVRELDRGQTSHAHVTAQAVSIAFVVALVGLAMAVYLISVHAA
jgi:putative membrane protein